MEGDESFIEFFCSHSFLLNLVTFLRFGSSGHRPITISTLRTVDVHFVCLRNVDILERFHFVLADREDCDRKRLSAVR